MNCGEVKHTSHATRAIRETKVAWNREALKTGQHAFMTHFQDSGCVGFDYDELIIINSWKTPPKKKKKKRRWWQKGPFLSVHRWDIFSYLFLFVLRTCPCMFKDIVKFKTYMPVSMHQPWELGLWIICNYISHNLFC